MSTPQGFNDKPRRTTPSLERPANLPVAHGMAPARPIFSVEPQPEPPAVVSGLIMAWRLFRRQAGVVALGLLIGLAAGTAATLLTRPEYVARATLQIDRESAKVVNGADETPVDNLSDEFFQTQYGLLKSRALATRVADALGLTRDDRFIDAMNPNGRHRAGPPLTLDQRRNAVVDLLQSHERVVPTRGSRLVAVTFSSPDASLSARVSNAFAENFIAAALDRHFEASSYARDFLERRLAEVKGKLEDSERDLVAYAARMQIIQLPSAGQPSAAEAGPSLPAANLESFNAALAAAKTERIRAEQKWRQAQSASGVGLTDILQSPTFQVLSQEHAKLAAEYQDKLRIYKPDYPDMKQLKARLDETQKQLDIEAQNIRDSLKSQYETALAEEKDLKGNVEGLKTDVLSLRGRNIQYTILQREVDTNRTLYDGLLQRYKEVGVAGGLALNNISIVDRAEPPTSPSYPKPLLNMLAATFAGLLLGGAMALAREAFDQAIRNPADMELGPELPILGSIPALKKSVTPTKALADGRSHLSEAYHSLRSALQFSTVDGFPKTLLVTSPWHGGGKTTTSFAIAQYVARLGFRVLLVDGDLRSPSVRALVGAENGPGLSSVLTTAAAWKDTVQATAYPNLFVVTSGPPAPNPAELLAGARLQMMVAEAAAVFDMIIFDGPPVMGLADAPIIGSVVSGCLMVVEAGRTTRSQLRQAMSRMTMAGAHVLGSVLTKYKTTHEASGYGYGYGYAYDYGSPDIHDGALNPKPVHPGVIAKAVARARRLISK